MTLTALRKLAQQSTRYGYFDHGSTVAVDCPQCGHRVETIYNMWTTNAKGKRMTKIAQLRAGVLDHLQFDCPAVQR